MRSQFILDGATKALVAVALIWTATSAGAAAGNATQADNRPAKASKHRMHQAKVVRPARHVRAPAPAFSPFARDRRYDTYVNGQYVGSDPDPGVRRTLRREWSEDSADRGRGR
jgi:hypothetical protein